MGTTLHFRTPGRVREHKSKFSNRLTSLSLSMVLGASVLAFLPVGASAQTLDGNFGTATMSKLNNLGDIGRTLVSSDPEPRYKVIINFKQPDLSSVDGVHTASADEVRISTIASARQALLNDILGETAAANAGVPGNDPREIEGAMYTPQIFAMLTQAEMEAFASHSDIEQISFDTLDAPQMDQSTVRVNANDVWAYGGSGNGYSVAVLDTGVKRGHEFITSGRQANAACYGTNQNFTDATAASYCPGGSTAITGPTVANDCATSFAQGCSHGTHVAGTAMGANTSRQSGEPFRGMAYQGRVIAVNVFTRITEKPGFNVCPIGTTCVLAFNSDQIKGLQQVYNWRNTYNVASVNMSLGGNRSSTPCDTDSRKPIIDLLRSARVATVISAGNNGFNTEVGFPGCISSAITVASSLDTSDTRSSFSNWGSLIDVVAPGSNIQSSVYGPSAASSSSYSNYNGTSMAAPHVAGAWAMLRTLYPTATVSQIESALELSGVPITSAGTTKPRIDVLGACRRLGSRCNAAGPLLASSILPTARGTYPGRSVTFFANVFNYGTATGTSCRPQGPGGVSFQYRATDASNNFIAPLNTPVNVGAGSIQNFVIGMTPTTTTTGTTSAIVMNCSNSSAAPSVHGLNYFIRGVMPSAGTYSDLVAISATIGNSGYIDIPGSAGTGFASVASINIGGTASITASIRQQPLGGSNPNYPATLQICRTNSSGVCQTPYSSSITYTHAANAVATFNVRAVGSGVVANNPATNRAHIYFRRGTYYTGATSVAVRTQ